VRQRELRELLPGAAGGIARMADADPAALGRRGGEVTRERYGRAYLAELARRAAHARWHGVRHVPHTVERCDVGQAADGTPLVDRAIERRGLSIVERGRRKPTRVVIAQILGRSTVLIADAIDDAAELSMLLSKWSLLHPISFTPYSATGEVIVQCHERAAIWRGR
jgi:hypothetical protein